MSHVLTHLFTVFRSDSVIVFGEPATRRPSRTRAAGAERLLVAGVAAALIATGFMRPARAASGDPTAAAVTSRTACTAAQGQLFIEEGRYRHAIREFTCVIAAQPTEVEGYRGRIEAALLLGQYADAIADHARVTALVLPVHPDARNIIVDGYAARLAIRPDDLPALTGASFARWYFFEYASALQLLNRLLDVQPDDLYGVLFRGSTRLLLGPMPNQGIADIELALELAPKSPDVRWVAADAYLYGRSDYARAFEEAERALTWGLDIPRVHAILASAYAAFGDLPAAATHLHRHIALVTTELVTTPPLAAASSLNLDLVPGRTYEIPIDVIAGEQIWIQTSSQDFDDTIMVLLAPDGSPVIGSDDYRRYFAGLKWVAGMTGTYRLWATSFEGINTGDLLVKRN